MSLTTTVNKITHTGNGSTTNFTWNFLISASSDLKVYVDGVLQTSGYSISSGLGNAAGGTIAFTSAPANNAKVQIVRTVALTQATDYVENEKFPANTHETALDKLTMMSQQLSETIDRSPTLAINTTATTPAVFPEPTASALLGWNAAGTALENSATTVGSMATQSASSVDIDGGNIDGTVIGAASAAAITGTTVTGSTSVSAPTVTGTTKVVTPEVEASSGSSLTLDAGGQDLTATSGATMSFGSPTYDVNATSVCTIDNTNTTNGVKIGTTVSGGKVYLGHTTSETTVNDNLTVTGDLTVNGTTITANATTITVDDKNIELGSVASPSDATADGGGITLKGASDKTIIWDNANDNWTSNQHLNISTGKEYKINNTKVLDASSLGSGVTSSSLTSVGTIATGTWEGTTIAVNQGGSGQTSYTDGQLLIGNSSGNTLAKATLTAGTNVSITNGNGSITIGSSFIQGEAEGTAAAMALALGG